MAITLQKSSQLKSVAILMMLFLHLFNREYRELFQPLIFLGSQPLSYYISLFCDACVPIFAFVSGYGLYFKFLQNRQNYKGANQSRLKNIYLNFWVIVILFAVGLGFFLGAEGYPGSVQKLLLNLTAIDPSYNGAWWFLTTYILFVLTSSFWFKLFERVNPYLFMLAMLVLYVTAFYFRMYRTDIFENSIAKWFHSQSALYFCTLFQFMLGAFALKFDWHGNVDRLFSLIKYKNITAMGGILVTVVLHALVPNFIVAPFTGLAFILLYLQVSLPPSVNKALDFFTAHATNLWLIHMFFYMIYFKEFIYSFQYVVPIFAVLVGLCLLSSYIVNYLNQFIKKWV